MSGLGRFGSAGIPEEDKLETLKKDIRVLMEELYPPHGHFEPKQYRQTNELLRRLNIRIRYIKLRELPNFPGKPNQGPLSFSYRAIRGEYRIYIAADADPSAYRILDLREKGHILFNHFARPAAHRAQFEMFFRRNMDTLLSRLFQGGLHLVFPGLYSSYLYNRFADMAQSMEINTKLFKQDWQEALQFLNRYRFHRALNDPSLIKGEAQMLLNRLSNRKYEGTEPNGHGYPRENWPLGLDWISYMSLLAGDLNITLHSISGGEQVGAGEIDAYNREWETAEQIQHAWENRDPLPGEEGEIPGKFRFGRDRTTEITDRKTSHRFLAVDNLQDLVRILRERSMVNSRKKFKTDLLYYINRNKYGNDLLIPRRQRLENLQSGKIVVLLDVSGSVPVALVRQVVGAIRRAEGAFDSQRGRLIAWSDSLRSDVSLEKLETIDTGGGTFLGGGIRYCERYLDEETSFFIISDFQDDLSQWLEAAKDLPGRKTAIGYGKTGWLAEDPQSLTGWFSMVGSNTDYRKTMVSLENFIRVFDTLIIRNY